MYDGYGHARACARRCCRVACAGVMIMRWQAEEIEDGVLEQLYRTSLTQDSFTPCPATCPISTALLQHLLLALTISLLGLLISHCFSQPQLFATLKCLVFLSYTIVALSSLASLLHLCQCSKQIFSITLASPLTGKSLV